MLANARPPIGRLLGQSLGPYRGYAEVLAALARLAGRGARLEVIGRSVRGEPIFAVHLGSTSPGARTAVVLSAVHPIEWIGVEVHLALLERLSWVDLADRAIVSVPLVNPDGFVRVEGHLRAGRRRFVRHNARGVDLNRNFDARWSERGLGQRLLSFLYASGSRPASEPAVEAIAHALSARRVDRAVSLHSFGGAVLYPSAATVLPVFDAAEQHAWAKRVARAADPKPYRALPASWFSLGMTQGGLDVDWFHERHGAVSLLVECSRGGVGIRPSRLLDPFAWFNPRGIEVVAAPLSEALSPFVRGAPL
jgi:predicted deacylase